MGEEIISPAEYKDVDITITSDDDGGLYLYVRNKDHKKSLLMEKRTMIKKDLQDLGKWGHYKELIANLKGT